MIISVPINIYSIQLVMKIKKHIKLFIYMFNSIILFSLLSFYSITVFAIVNMDGIHFKRGQDTFVGDVDLTMAGTSGNSTSTEIAFNTQLSWLDEDSINLAILGYQYGETNDIRNVDKSFIHYRYIAKVNKSKDWELFAQVEKNEFTRLSYRALLGAGIRFLSANSKRHSAFFGLGAFSSKEEIKFVSGLTDHGIEEVNRANIYFLSKYKINPILSFSNVIYYQPSLSKLSDFRTLVESNFDYKINNNLSLRLRLDASYDSEPSQSIESTDISYTTGFKYSFE